MIKKALENLKIASLNEMQHIALTTKKEADVILLSPTGSGKTLAFLLPLLENLDKKVIGIQALILVPSRELALQIEQVFKTMSTGFKVNCCYGGHAVKIEKNSLSEAPTVLIGTPGRLAFHIKNGNVDTQHVHTLILDEFDKALEFGFQDDMSYIIKSLTALKKRVLTSATKMAEIPTFTGVTNPVEIDFLKDVISVPDLKVYIVPTAADEKLDTLFSLICKIGTQPTFVFCNHREAVDRISDLLFAKGIIHGIFHGGMEQDDREKALLKFRNGSTLLLITTDLASRGLDIPEIEHIIHYQLPHNEEAYTHRNGRTARMHTKGIAYLLMTDEEKAKYIKPDTEILELPSDNTLPEPTSWCTMYIGAGKKDKVNKIDIVGLLHKKGELKKEDLGLIEVLDHSSYAAIKRNRIERTVRLISNEKIKNKKVKIEISR